MTYDNLSMLATIAAILFFFFKIPDAVRMLACATLWLLITPFTTWWLNLILIVILDMVYELVIFYLTEQRKPKQSTEQ